MSTKLQIPNPFAEESTAGSNTSHKFGTFGGVFTPTLLTILGAIMYLRTGWVVGNGGLLGAVTIILLANVITISTGLSISSAVTNIRVRAGGPFSIISQSLGLEVGGSVSVPFYFAQAISVAFYIFAFTEGWLGIFPNHPEILVILGSFAVAYGIAFISANVAVRTQFLILAVVVLSLVSVFLGSFAINGSGGFTETPQIWGSFADGDFWHVFSIFFPAVTGILAGVNMSGDLKDARRSIPLGMLSAVGLTAVIYLALSYWFSRVATPEQLVANPLLVVEASAFPPLVLAGILAATFSSALTSLVGAPRLLQAIAEHRILPGSAWIAEVSHRGEPRRAMIITGVLALAALGFGLVGGGLDAIAPLMTMFFLVAYIVLNLVVLFEQFLGLISFRPLLRIPAIVPLIGLLGCIFAMFLINPAFSLIAIGVIIGLYVYLLRRHLTAPWSDVRSGMFVTLAEWAAKRVSGLPTAQERAWKPDLLFPVTSTEEFLGSYQLLQALAYPRGSVRVVGLGQDQSSFVRLDKRVRALNDSGIFARTAYVATDDFGYGVQIGLDLLSSVLFRPNGLFFPITPAVDPVLLQAFMDRAQANKMGLLFYAGHQVVGLGQEKVINVWIREQSPHWEVGLRLSNLDLALLLAYQLRRNWQGQINLLMVVSDPEEQANGEAFLNLLIDLGRMPGSTKAIVTVGELDDYLQDAPRADLDIFGLGTQLNLDFMQQMVLATQSSCLFVRDSGLESALA